MRDAVVARTGLNIQVIYNCLNRRKIDLIPLPEWRDPPKSEIGKLLQAVQARLVNAGLAGGLREVFELAEKVARERGLRDARITGDVKHIEVGLADKSDAVNWVVGTLAQQVNVGIEDILIAGDEFGPIAGFEGSDYKMVTPQAKGAVFVSVGPEPDVVPPEVIHLGGGRPASETSSRIRSLSTKAVDGSGGSHLRATPARLTFLSLPPIQAGSFGRLHSRYGGFASGQDVG